MALAITPLHEILTTGAAPEFWKQGVDVALNQKYNQNTFCIGGSRLGETLLDSLSSHPLKLTPTGFDAFKMLVTDDVAGQLIGLDLTGSTFEVDIKYFSLQRFQNLRTLRLAKCRQLTDGGPVGERHAGGLGQGSRLEVLDLSECPSIKGIAEIVFEVCGSVLFMY